MRYSIIFYILILLNLACNPPKNVISANDSKFIFRATTEQIGTATLPEISDPGNCIVVKVNEVISAPPGFTDWTGKLITVAVKEPGRQKPGIEKVYYTNGWLYGKSLAVIEISSRNANEISNKEVLDGVNKNQEQKIKERIKSSELVISGQIFKIDTLRNTSKVISEHEPEWRLATVNIDSVLKGRQLTSTVFRFPSSRDIMWIDSPKFSKSQRGIWLLRKLNANDDVFTITEKEDYFSIDSLSIIRSLMK